MDDIDEALARLARAPIPAALDGLEAHVLARIATPPASRAGFGVGAIMVAADTACMSSAFFSMVMLTASDCVALASVVAVWMMLLARETSMAELRAGTGDR